ncbi:conserved hypothetical protein [Microsporum canis CBS 113480]|uniref:BRCT domain-containing protein n=1 Tax=Arthroderma otae (strain ATCC MYA-4605 / CBS 113480) TaxID=554155 RepID=C5FCF5_ARTOC|nr:conserved hypothetical protein [Microsporum canis CBS 113480]EEQ27399.1 conserved hypothetical protein [Microsporum canis CBS 113480]
MPSKDTNISPSIRQILSIPSTTALETFDAWNSVSTGHQRAEVKQTNSSGWSQVRSQKLSAQYGRGGNHAAKTGKWAWLDKDGRKKRGPLNDGNGDIRHLMGGVKKRKIEDDELVKRLSMKQGPHTQGQGQGQVADGGPVMSLEQSKGAEQEVNDTHERKDKQIFANLTIYINGSTMPLISDHKLKNTLIDHGAKISIGLARRSVTHVILGCPNGETEGNSTCSSAGAGGGLAAGKMRREITRVGGMGVKFVGVEWVLESIKAGCRLPEARFANVHIASKRQKSVLDFMTKG